ncbi:MAG: sigma-70 family RNA polymerase sigma factor [Ignavibacteriaceae bacterium]|nr:sigma-70 family RNA polymerase sigma factor [Ignavibacteriaceae bacterium]
MNKFNKESFFREIAGSHKGIFYKVARTYCAGSPGEQEDLIQEILLQVWKSIDKYNDSYALSTWLYRISINTAISYYRKHSRISQANVRVESESGYGGTPPDNSEQERISLLMKFISELGEVDKAIMLLYLEEKTHAEMSAILGFSVSNIGTRIGRIKEKLKIRFLESEK